MSCRFSPLEAFDLNDYSWVETSRNIANDELIVFLGQDNKDAGLGSITDLTESLEILLKSTIMYIIHTQHCFISMLIADIEKAYTYGN